MSQDCPLAFTLAAHLRRGREQIVTRWLNRIADRVAIPVGEIFPTDELLDHVPLLVDGIADYLEDAAEEITADAPVVAKAMELGELRYAQGFDAHQILKEYEILGGVLFDFLSTTADEVEEPCTRAELLVCAHRVFRSIAVIQQYTTGHFLRRAEERTAEREERLRGFNRAVSHEMKNRIGAAGGALDMLAEDWIADDPAQRARFVSIAARNVKGMKETLETLLELSRIDAAVGTRNVLLCDVAAEVRRQLRDFAESRGVEIELAPELPAVEVPAAALELALSNYVSNAIKYRSHNGARCWVRVEGELREAEGGGRAVVVRVRDNGIGVPPEAQARLFERFFRAHEETVTGEEGSGLGLSLVREAVTAAGGDVWIEPQEMGSCFVLSVPIPEPAT